MRRLVAVAVALVALWAAPGALAAGTAWCGSGEQGTDLRDTVAGAQVHVVYVVPNDGAARFAQSANQIADDAEAINAWWLTQDPQRSIRFDTALFGSCVGLDISFLRLQRSSSSILGDLNQYGGVVREVENTFDRDYTIDLVYYDGPSSAGVCGTASGRLQEVSVHSAVVWLQGCGDVERPMIAAHELVHAFGALPSGAPHPCPRDTGHPCDSELDILWPRVTDVPFAQKVLDVGHDDYYAHSGSWDDVQDSPFLHRVDVPQVALNVAFAGKGHVASDVPGVDCTAACSTQWDPNTRLNLEAEGVAGTRFVRWQGACTGSASCLVRIDGPRSVSAVFGPVRVPVRVSVSGRGSVACSPKCSARFSAGDLLRLTAKPARGWKFSGWAGACKGTRPTCVPATDFAVSARATFRKR